MGSGQGQPTWALHIPSKLLYYTSKKQNGGYFCLRLYILPWRPQGAKIQLSDFNSIPICQPLEIKMRASLTKKKSPNKMYLGLGHFVPWTIETITSI